MHDGYDPAADGFTWREWFAHALKLVLAGPVGPYPGLPERCGDAGFSK